MSARGYVTLFGSPFVDRLKASRLEPGGCPVVPGEGAVDISGEDRCGPTKASRTAVALDDREAG